MPPWDPASSPSSSTLSGRSYSGGGTRLTTIGIQRVIKDATSRAPARQWRCGRSGDLIACLALSPSRRGTMDSTTAGRGNSHHGRHDQTDESSGRGGAVQGAVATEPPPCTPHLRPCSSRKNPRATLASLRFHLAVRAGDSASNNFTTDTADENGQLPGKGKRRCSWRATRCSFVSSERIQPVPRETTLPNAGSHLQISRVLARR